MDKAREWDPRTVRIGIAVLIGVAVLIFLATKLIGGDDDNDSGAPIGLSGDELIDKAGDLSHVAYWVGPQPGVDQYELTELDDGRIYVRYLTGAAEVGDANPNFLTVGTYEVPGAKEALKRGAGSQEVVHEDGYDLLVGGGSNVYVVFDSQPDLQIEIFSPDPEQAESLAKSGALIPIG